MTSLERKIQDLEAIIKRLSECSGGMLSSTDFLQLVIKDDLENARKDFWKRNFDSYGRQFIIDPFNPKNLTPFSYDLSVGDQIYHCNTRQVIETGILNNCTYWLEPRETIIIKTKEFIALSPYYSATVWPRFKMPRESIFQSMVKIDPTWYGELGVAVTNVSHGKYPIEKGKTFATLIIYGLKTKTGMYLYRTEDIPQLEERAIPLDLDNEKDKIIKSIKESEELRDICEIRDDLFILKEAPSSNQFNILWRLSKSEKWKNIVTLAIQGLPREMQQLGLNTLESIRPTKPNVRPLNRDEVQNTDYNLSDLENLAIRYGLPFNCIPALHNLILENIESEITPRIRSEVEAAVFPKTVTLTLTVLGFLSLIVAIAAFVSSKYRPGSQSIMEIDLPASVSLVVLALAIVLIISILILTFRRPSDSYALKKIKKKLKELERQQN